MVFLTTNFNAPSGMKEIGLELKNMIRMEALIRGYLGTLLSKKGWDDVQKDCITRLHLKVQNSMVLNLAINLLGLPYPCFIVPYEKNQYFTGRAVSLEQLFKKF